MAKNREPAAPAQPAPPADRPAQELIVPTPRAMTRGALTVLPDSGPAVLTNIPDTPAGRALAFNAQSAADYKLLIGKPLRLRLTAYVVHLQECVDKETGEVYPVCRCVLVQQDGTTVASTGPAVRDRLAVLIRESGPGPWVPGLDVQLVARPCADGQGVWHDLLRVVEGLPW